MANADNDNLLARHFIEDQIGVGWRHDPAQAAFAGELAGVGILHQKSGDRLYACLNVARALWRSLGNVGENVGEFG
jgi:hypothetical protein